MKTLIYFVSNTSTIFLLGASLDGIYDGKIIEIKCPLSMAEKNLEPDQLFGMFVKFIYSEKATKICEIFRFLSTYSTHSQK